MNRFLALDFETSGTDPQRHAPVSLGVVLFENGKVVDSKEWRIGKVEKRAYEVGALEISGITWPQVKAAPPVVQVMREFAEWTARNDARNLTVLAFNAPFDFAFYGTCLYLASEWIGRYPNRTLSTPTAPLLGPWQCARLKAQDALRLDKYSLDTVSEHFGLSRETGEHGAEEDAILAGKVWLALNEIGVDQRFATLLDVPGDEPETTQNGAYSR